MLSRAENELLTQVGSGTPMGELMRCYWLPALLSEEIATPDCPPVRVRLLGEDLIAFRDSQGRVGLLGEHCAHRGTSLFYGRNEECGLTCIYHGWKYDVDGNVLETPAEPASSDFKKKLRHAAYPCKEIAGIVFTYMGPAEKLPVLPRYEWVSLAPEQFARSNPISSAITCRASRATSILRTRRFCTTTIFAECGGLQARRRADLGCGGYRLMACARFRSGKSATEQIYVRTSPYIHAIFQHRARSADRELRRR